MNIISYQTQQYTNLKVEIIKLYLTYNKKERIGMLEEYWELIEK